MTHRTDINQAANAAGLRVDVACSLDEIAALEADWRGLELRTGNASGAFQGFDWNISWCRAQAGKTRSNKTDTPFVVVVWQDKKAVAIWPLQKGFTSGIKTLSWQSSPALQYGDILLDVSCDNDLVNKLAWDFIIRSGDADLLRLDNVSANSPIYEFLDERCTTPNHSSASVLNLARFDDWADYQASLKTTTRRARRKRFNKFARSGDLVFRVHEQAPEYEKLVSLAIDWKCRWLEQLHWPNRLMSDPTFKTFVQSLGDKKSDSKGKWVVGELSLDGKPVGIEIGAVYGDRYISFLGAYDLAWSKFSPGKIELESMVEWAMKEGIAYFDLLCVPARYKSDWTDMSVPVTNFTHACNLRGKMLHSVWLKRLRPMVKYSLQHIPASQRRMLASLFEKQLRNIHSGKN